MNPRWRNPLTALSLANLLLLPVWHILLVGIHHPYFNQHHPARGYFPVTVAVMVLGAVGLWLAWWLACRIGPRARHVAKFLFAVSLLAPLNYLRTQISWLEGGYLEKLLPAAAYWGLVALAIGGVLLVLWKWADVGARWGQKAVLVLVPFVPMTTAQAVWYTASHTPEVGHRPAPAPELARTATHPRLVWIIFDEFDHRLAFDDRPASLALPELDRWRRQEITATQAYPPAGMTLLSMPALITGRLVEKVKHISADDLALTHPGRTAPVRWSQADTVFRRLRAAGGNSALIGWFHPYGRVVGQDLIDCQWVSNEADNPFIEDVPPGQMVGRMVGWLGRYLPLLPRLKWGGDYYRQRWVDYYRFLHGESARLLASPSWDLLVQHWLVPHPRGLYNRHTGQFLGPDDAYPSSYLDNLALVDRTLAEIRQQLERQGEWSQTAVLVSSDHWWRHRLHVSGMPAEEAPLAKGADHRVPFLLHLPGGKPATYQTPFNTVLSGDLLMAIRQGEVRQTADLLKWLDRHRQPPAESPITDTPWPYLDEH